MARIIYGALAGVAATVAMTATMRRLHAALPAGGRYPLPPREIVAGARREGHRRAPLRDQAAAEAMLAHFAYGAATGALFALLGRRSAASGIGYGLGVWAASYLGWLPAARILEPATRHPVPRSAMMLVAHLVWGATLAAGLREIEAAEAGGFRRGRAPVPDAAGPAGEGG